MALSRTANSYFFVHRRFSVRSSGAPAQIKFTLDGLTGEDLLGPFTLERTVF